MPNHPRTSYLKLIPERRTPVRLPNLHSGEIQDVMLVRSARVERAWKPGRQSTKAPRRPRSQRATEPTR